MERLTANERQVLAGIDPPAMLHHVEIWAAVNSGTRNLAGLATMAALLGDAFSALPGDLRLVDPVSVDSVGMDGRVTLLDHGRHLHLAVRPAAERRLLLIGHMDTVYPADHPFQSLHHRDDGALVGPGVTDMKGGLAVMLAALLAVETDPRASRIGYDVLVNSDEETGSHASAPLIAALAHGKIAAFGYEPALPDGTLAGARGGTGNFSLVVRGRSAHAGRNPEEGRNALVAAADLAVSLAGESIPGCSINPARIDGGGPNNVVPDLAILRVNLRPRDTAATDAAARLIDATIAAVRDRHDVRIERHGSFNRPPKPVDAAAERLFALVGAAGADLDLTITRRDTGGVCDGNNIAAAAIPVIDTMGVRGGAIHSADEYLLVDSLAERAALSALAILRLADGYTP
jgi:glutamate carboxypeptidase